MGDIDLYKGCDPGEIWDRRHTSDAGGVNSVSLGGKTRGDVWETLRYALDGEGIAERLRGEKVVELGSGKYPFFRNYCVDCGVKEFMGVDLFEPPLFDGVERMSDSSVEYFQEDCLRFLQKQPSGNAIIAQIMLFCRENIMGSVTVRPNEIIRAICLEVYRVVAPGKFLISWNAGLPFRQGLVQAGFVESDSEVIYSKPVL